MLPLNRKVFKPGQLVYFEDDLYDRWDRFIFQILGHYPRDHPDGGYTAAFCFLRSPQNPLEIDPKNLLMFMCFTELCHPPLMRVVGEAEITIKPIHPQIEKNFASYGLYSEFGDTQPLNHFSSYYSSKEIGQAMPSRNIPGTMAIFSQLQVAENFFDAPHLRYEPTPASHYPSLGPDWDHLRDENNPHWRSIFRISFIKEQAIPWLKIPDLAPGNVYLVQMKEEKGYIPVQLIQRLEIPEIFQENIPPLGAPPSPFFGILLLVDSRVFSTEEEACEVLNTKGIKPWITLLTNSIHIDHYIWKHIGELEVPKPCDPAGIIRKNRQVWSRYHTGHLTQALQAKVGIREWDKELEELVKSGKELLRLST